MPCTDEQQLTGDQRKLIIQLLRQIRGQIRDLRVTLTAIENAVLLMDFEARMLRLTAIIASDCARNERDCRRIEALLDDLAAHAYPTSFAEVTGQVIVLWEQVMLYWPDTARVESAEIDRITRAATVCGTTLDELMAVINSVAG